MTARTKSRPVTMFWNRTYVLVLDAGVTGFERMHHHTHTHVTPRQLPSEKHLYMTIKWQMGLSRLV